MTIKQQQIQRKHDQKQIDLCGRKATGGIYSLTLLRMYDERLAHATQRGVSHTPTRQLNHFPRLSVGILQPEPDNFWNSIQQV